MTEHTYRTFILSDKVTVEQVTFKNRYGITVAADLYLSKDIDTSQKYPALIVGTPYAASRSKVQGFMRRIWRNADLLRSRSMNHIMVKAAARQDTYRLRTSLPKTSVQPLITSARFHLWTEIKSV